EPTPAKPAGAKTKDQDPNAALAALLSFSLPIDEKKTQTTPPLLPDTQGDVVPSLPGSSVATIPAATETALGASTASPDLSLLMPKMNSTPLDESKQTAAPDNSSFVVPRPVPKLLAESIPTSAAG